VLLLPLTVTVTGGAKVLGGDRCWRIDDGARK